MSPDDQSLFDILTGRRGGPDGFIPGEWFGGGTSAAVSTGGSGIVAAILKGVFVAIVAAVVGLGYIMIRYVLPAMLNLFVELVGMALARR